MVIYGFYQLSLTQQSRKANALAHKLGKRIHMNEKSAGACLGYWHPCWDGLWQNFHSVRNGRILGPEPFDCGGGLRKGEGVAGVGLALPALPAAGAADKKGLALLALPLPLPLFEFLPADLPLPLPLPLPVPGKDFSKCLSAVSGITAGKKPRATLACLSASRASMYCEYTFSNSGS